MQEDLKAFGVKIESSFATQAETEARRLAEPGRADHHTGSHEEVEGRVRKGAFPQSVKVADDEIIPVGADDSVVRDGVGAVPFDSEPTRVANLKAGSKGVGLSLGEGWSDAPAPRTQHDEED